MKNVLFLVAVCIATAACNKYESQGGSGSAPVYPSYQIGDYFSNDTLQGIVFFTTAGGTSGLMVSLEETHEPWCTPSHINNETGGTNPYDGWNNTNIVSSNYDLRNFPAIKWSYLRNTWHLVHYDHRMINKKQWYVPSSTELRYLLQNQEAVNATLASMGYPTLEGKTYWSSTETGTRGAAAAFVRNGLTIVADTLKTQTFFVRAIRTF